MYTVTRWRAMEKLCWETCCAVLNYYCRLPLAGCWPFVYVESHYLLLLSFYNFFFIIYLRYEFFLPSNGFFLRRRCNIVTRHLDELLNVYGLVIRDRWPAEGKYDQLKIESIHKCIFYVRFLALQRRASVWNST